VDEIGFDRAQRLLDATAMPRQIKTVVALKKPLERTHVIRHVAFGWRNDGRVPGHHVIAGE
jgi:hypothetical protein